VAGNGRRQAPIFRSVADTREVIVVPRAGASSRTVVRVGVRSPRSSIPTYVEWRPAASARAAWVKPADCVFKENGAPPEFVEAVRRACRAIDFRDRTKFWEQEAVVQVRPGSPTSPVYAAFRDATVVQVASKPKGLGKVVGVTVSGRPHLC
jgi:hypothetical protein